MRSRAILNRWQKLYCWRFIDSKDMGKWMLNLSSSYRKSVEKGDAGGLKNLENGCFLELSEIRGVQQEKNGLSSTNRRILVQSRRLIARFRSTLRVWGGIGWSGSEGGRCGGYSPDWWCLSGGIFLFRLDAEAWILQKIRVWSRPCVFQITLFPAFIHDLGLIHWGC